jgi:hypothetical protein
MVANCAPSTKQVVALLGYRRLHRGHDFMSVSNCVHCSGFSWRVATKSDWKVFGRARGVELM